MLVKMWTNILHQIGVLNDGTNSVFRRCLTFVVVFLAGAFLGLAGAFLAASVSLKELLICIPKAELSIGLSHNTQSLVWSRCLEHKEMFHYR